MRRTVGILLLITGLGGCASLTGGLSDNIVQAIVNHNDPATVRDGAPAYLLMIDGFIADDPDDSHMLEAGASLYSAYAAIFVDDPRRAQRLTARAREYGRRALCLGHPDVCAAERGPFPAFAAALGGVGRADIEALYTYGVAWAVWIDVQSSDWNALADLPKVEAVFRRVVGLDDGYENGQPWLFLGIMNSYLPPAMGGRPATGRDYFEKAIALSDGRNLSAKVELANRYARLVFDRELHDRLLNEVLAADPVAPGLTLSNTLARQQAAELLQSSADYFLE